MLRGDTTRGGNEYYPYAAMVEGVFPRSEFREPSLNHKRAANVDERQTEDYDAYVDTLMRRKPKTDVPLKELPMLIRFRNVADPATVERVDPNNLAASFGPGVVLTRATLEITDDPVTTGIVKRLPWLANDYPEKRLVPATGGPLNDVPLANHLIFKDFREVQ